jgi:hypothetical protein
MKLDTRAAASVGRLRTAMAASCIALAACGGGGGSSAPPPANLSSAPAAAAMNAYFQASHSSTLTATYQGNTITLQQSIAPNPATTTFEGSTVESGTETVSITENGALVANSVSTTYYTLNPFAIAGSVNSNGTEYEVVQTFSTIPAAVSVGAAGAIYTSTIYHDSSKAVIDGTVTATYSVGADSPTVLDFCTNAAITANAGNPDGMTNATQVNCYRVDSSGNATLFKVTVLVSGVSLTFQ